MEAVSVEPRLEPRVPAGSDALPLPAMALTATPPAGTPPHSHSAGSPSPPLPRPAATPSALRPLSPGRTVSESPPQVHHKLRPFSIESLIASTSIRERSQDVDHREAEADHQVSVLCRLGPALGSLPPPAGSDSEDGDVDLQPRPGPLNLVGGREEDEDFKTNPFLYSRKLMNNNTLPPVHGVQQHPLLLGHGHAPGLPPPVGLPGGLPLALLYHSWLPLHSAGLQQFLQDQQGAHPFPPYAGLGPFGALLQGQGPEGQQGSGLNLGPGLGPGLGSTNVPPSLSSPSPALSGDESLSSGPGSPAAHDLSKCGPGKIT